MNAEVFKHVINNKDKLVSALHDSKFEQTVNLAKTRWTIYDPIRTESEIVGIDSSYNSARYQGLEFWLSTGSATNVSQSTSLDLFKYGLERSRERAGHVASELEMDLCWDMSHRVDHVLMDGSLHSKILERDTANGMFFNAKMDKTWQMFTKLKKFGNIVFISKTSYTKVEFGKSNPVGDIYYYGKACNNAGFSKVFEDDRYGSNAIISTLYVRLADWCPLLKLELFGSGHTESEIKLLVNHLANNSFKGYPYSLKLAHDRCTITHHDMTRLSNICGFSTEIGARQVLG